MPKRSSKDINQVAFQVVQHSTASTAQKNPAAVALGRLGGLKGGKARSAKLSAEQKREIALMGARKRWANPKQNPG